MISWQRHVGGFQPRFLPADVNKGGGRRKGKGLKVGSLDQVIAVSITLVYYIHISYIYCIFSWA